MTESRLSKASAMGSRSRTLAFPVDQIGVWTSTLCVIHCLLTPVVLSLSTVSAHFLPSEERTHRTLAVVITALGAIALVKGYRRHRSWRVLALMAVGLAFIFGGAYWGDHLPSHGVEVLVTLIGSGFMIAAHRTNHTFCRDCSCSHSG
jgi:peptidoglycan/LPS O-acetylase OafA/YrhL